MDVELTPEQPPEVDEAVARLLEQTSAAGAAPIQGPDPWWRAGLADAHTP
ncbi:MAG: hypothetical protein H0X39_17290 [Actinobacteria bacterium]|nr:hypothetical protein [Actinomycetota bacterium]